MALQDVEHATIVSDGCRGFAWESMLNWIVVTQTGEGILVRISYEC